MISLIHEQKKLSDYIMKRLGLNWEQYSKRFAGTVPLMLRSTSLYTEKFYLEQVHSEIDLIGMLGSPCFSPEPIKNRKFVAGFTKRITKEEVESLNYLFPNFLGVTLLVHKRVIDIMHAICPNDFNFVQFNLISLNKQVEQFEVRNFYAIQTLKVVNAFDPNRCKLSLNEIINEMLTITGYYKNNPWLDGCKLSRDKDGLIKCDSYIFEKPCKIALEIPGHRTIWHPELAKELPVSSLAGFFLDTEVGC